MSSQIPTRRVTRATRVQDENAVRGSQVINRGAAKPTGAPPAAGSSKPAGNSLDTNAQNKRKREALGEVTNNKNKNVPRGISKDHKPGKPTVVITKPAQRTATRVQASAAASKETEALAALTEEQNEDAMVIDEPMAVQPLQRVSRRLLTRNTATVTSTTVANATTTRRGTLTKRSDIGATYRQQAVVIGGQADDEDERAIKRRRTSEAGEEEIVEVEAEVVEAPFVDNHPGISVEPEEAEEKEVTGWDDLDKDDFDDPMMVSEYVGDIFKYLSECEEKTLPNPNYIQHQAEIRWSQRAILMDFLVGLHQQFRLCPETLYLAVNLIDRFLSQRVVSLVKLQLVGLAGLFIAAKFEEIVAPSAQHYLKAAAVEDELKQEDILKAERYILKTLNYNVSAYPQPMNWLRRISKADDYDPHVRTVAKYFLEIHVLERKLLGVKPSLLAAAAIWLARLVLNHVEWTPNLAHYSGYTEKKIIPTANIMLNYCLRTEKHEHFEQKYASRKFCKASVYVTDWVETRWTLGTKISLADELQFVKELAREKAAQGSP